jgi:hypothetical protein
MAHAARPEPVARLSLDQKSRDGRGRMNTPTRSVTETLRPGGRTRKLSQRRQVGDCARHWKSRQSIA